MAAIIALVVAGIVLLVVVAASVRITQEYERGVIFRLGRYAGVRGPGLFFIIPIIERMFRLDLRTVTMDVPSQEAITGDNITVGVNAVIYFRVMSPEQAVVRVADYARATWLIAQTSLRSIIGQSDLDDLLSKRDEVNQKLQDIIDRETEPWGVKVSSVELRDVEIPDSMQRAIARQAEAERDRRAKIIHAEGEYEAAERLVEAGRVLSETPSALQLRYLSTLSEMVTERQATLFFPIPMDVAAGLSDEASPNSASEAGGSPDAR